MDVSEAPIMDAIVLTGLDFSMKPERVRYEVDKGFITPFPEVKVMHQIKSLAVMVYNQEKMTSLYHGNICDARNPLAYFICAVHRQQAPQPQTHTRQGSTSSVESNSSTISCKSKGNKKNCELPKLITSSMLPLGYWDGLYYALVSEIRSLHQNLQQRFGFGCERGTAPLHHNGPDGTTNQPINAIELAAMLEAAWYTLMDNRLVAALDDAVRMRKMREELTKQLADPTPLNKDGSPARPPIVYGLMDINDLAPEIINALLWDKHKNEIDRACTENFEDESMMTAYRAEVRQKQIEEGIAAAKPLKSALPCVCHLTCVCNLKCDQTAEGCTCENHVHLYHVQHTGGDDSSEPRDKFIKQDGTVRNQFIGTAPTNLAQMQIASLAYPDVRRLAYRHQSKETNNHEEFKDSRPYFGRQRTNTTNTANSELAYVPSIATSHRGAKDIGFNGRESMHRYPILQSQAQPMMTTGETEPPGDATQSVARKPVPSSSVPITQIQVADHDTRSDYTFPDTPPPSSPVGYGPFSQASSLAYPPIPESQGQHVFSPSFYTSGARNHSRSDESSGPQSQTFHFAHDYTSLLGSHPSSLADDHEAFPTLTRPATRSPSKKGKRTSPSTSNFFTGFKTFRRLSNGPQEPLNFQPTPDFIAPKVASKQRYVSAGGSAKLAERTEIAGPAFRQGPSVPEHSGHGVMPESISALMQDPEWVRKHFGDAALDVAAASPEETFRSSNESSEADDKRDRTSSGASKMGKVRKIFSRKDSASRGEEE